MGVSADFFKNKKGEPKISKVNNWATLPIFKWPKRGPVINFAGGPVINFGNGHFFHFFAFKNVLKYLFLQCFLNINQELPKKWPKTKR